MSACDNCHLLKLSRVERGRRRLRAGPAAQTESLANGALRGLGCRCSRGLLGSEHSVLVIQLPHVQQLVCACVPQLLGVALKGPAAGNEPCEVLVQL